jgi:hypothetical protein
MRYEEPDTVTVAVFSEVPELLSQLAGAYAGVARRLGGSVTVWQWQPPRDGRRQGSSPERRLVVEPPAPFGGSDSLRVRRWDRDTKGFAEPDRWAASWEGVIGVALEIHAPAAFPLFSAEDGQHQFNAARNAGKCLVETSPLPMTGAVEHSFYMPPAGIERRGAISSQQRRRVYHPERDAVEDLLLGRKVAWNDHSLENLLANLLEECFTHSARSLLG